MTLTHLLDRAKEERQHAVAYVDEGVGQVFWPSLCPDVLSEQRFLRSCGRNVAALAPARGERSSVRVRDRLADSQTDGLEFAKPLWRLVNRIAALCRLSIWEAYGKTATPILGDVFLDCSRGRPRFCRRSQDWVRCPTGATGNGLAVTARSCLLVPDLATYSKAAGPSKKPTALPFPPDDAGLG